MKRLIFCIGMVCAVLYSCGDNIPKNSEDYSPEIIPIRDKSFHRMEAWEAESSHLETGDYLASRGEQTLIEEEGAIGFAIAGIASHHLLIGPYLHYYYRELRSNHPEILTFVILGPDHFNLTKKEIAIADCGFSFDGKVCGVPPNVPLAWKKTLGIPADNGVFYYEHSIYSQIPFIMRYFPEARIIPVVVNEHCSSIRLAELSVMIGEFLYNNPASFLLLSMDFSHHLSREETARRDKDSLEVIMKCMPGRTRKLTSDAAACWSVFSHALSRRQLSFTLLFHTTNEVFMKRKLNDITSYFFAFYREEES